MSFNTLAAYQTARDQLLAKIIDTLHNDDRFVAAWLTGSYGRGEIDAVSDLDLNVVVGAADAVDLCARPQMVQAGTTHPRLGLISQFGQPVIIHENHFNAPANGSFTFVLYADNALMIDWTLIPQAQAQRPQMAQLLFDKIGIAVQPIAEPDAAQCHDILAEKTAFFWMMLAVTAKYMVRQDAVKVQGFLDILHHLLQDIEHLLDGQGLHYRRGSLMELQVTRDAQLMTCRVLIQRMRNLKPQLMSMGIDLPSAPAEAIERLLDLH